MNSSDIDEWCAKNKMFLISKEAFSELLGDRNTLIFKLRQEGMTYSKIGEFFNISSGRVRQICARKKRDKEDKKPNAIRINHLCKGSFSKSRRAIIELNKLKAIATALTVANTVPIAK